MCLLPKINFYSWQNVVTEFVPWLTLISLNLTLIPPYCSQKGYRTRRYLCEHTLANIHKVISTTSDPNHHGRGYTTGYTDCLPQCWHHKIVIPTNYKDRRSPSQYLSMQMTKNVFPILFLTFFLFLLFKSLAIVQDWKQADAHASLHLKRSTKWYKQPPTLNSKVTYLKQANLIALSSVEIIKSWYWWITRVKYLLHDVY